MKKRTNIYDYIDIYYNIIYILSYNPVLWAINLSFPRGLIPVRQQVEQCPVSAVHQQSHHNPTPGL